MLGAWLVMLGGAGLMVLRLPALLTNHIALPGTDSERAEQLLETEFGQRSVGSFTLVVQTEGDARSRLDDVTRAARRAAAELPTGKLVAVEIVAPHIAVAQIVSTLDSAGAKARTDAMRAAIGTIAGAHSYLTGLAATEHDLEPIVAEDLRKGELVIALPIAAALLVLTFGTLTFLLPLAFALFSIVTTLGLVWICANVMELTTYITNLVSLIGLGIAVDYSLIIVYRFREERAAGAGPEDAIVRTMQTAGRAVVVSGTAVAIGLALLVFLPLPFLRGFGIGGVLIPAVSVIGAVTLLPVLLSLIGPALERVRLTGRASAGEPSANSGFWPVLARGIMRRPLPVAVGSVLVLLALSLPLRDLHVSPGSNDGLPTTLESVHGREVLATALGAGATAPANVVIDSGQEGGAAEPDVIVAVGRLAIKLATDPQVAGIYFRADNTYSVDPSARFVNLVVFSRQDFANPQTLALIERLRATHIPAAGFAAGTSVLVGGAPAAGLDFLDVVLRWFPWLVLATLLATYVLLMRAFRSLVLPLKAIILNLLSIASACGLTVAMFKWGWGAPFGLSASDQVEAWIPVMVFAMLFGLSMDYEVFLVSRMREAWDGGASNEEAVIAGLTRTGRLVTSAGLIMFAAFMGFVAGSVVGLQQFGFMLAMSILIDVTLVRALLLPAAMKLFGRWNWYLPRAAAIALRVTPSVPREQRSVA